MDSIPPTEVPEILQLLEDSQTTNYMAVASLTLLVLEHVSTFQEEVKYVWQSRLSLWSVLYVWTRYFTLIAISIDLSFMFGVIKSSKICQNVLFVELAMSTMIEASVDGILVLRVWLLFGKKKTLLCILVPLLVAEIVGLITFGLLTILPLTNFVDLGPILKGCYSTKVPRLFTFYALPYLLMSILMFCMTAYKCGRQLWNGSKTHMPVITLFLRDGIFFFFTIMLVTTAAIIVWSKARATLAELVVIPAAVIPSLVGTRILLNIKSLVSEVEDDGGGAVELSTLGSQSLPPSAVKAHIPWYLRTGEEDHSWREGY